MKMFRNIVTDPSFYLLLLFNAFFIYEYKQHPESYVTIVWIFWCQSILIGVFNFLELLTTKNVNAQGFRMNDQAVDPKNGRGCYATFFLIHYGGFHLGYFIFLAMQLGFAAIDPVIFKISLLILIATQTAAFFQHKQAYKTAAPDLSFLFFAPYLRVVPMHLMILAPAFFHLQPAMVFLLLKMVMDVAGYLLTRRLAGKVVVSNGQ